MQCEHKRFRSSSDIDLSVIVCTYNSRPETLEIVDKLLLPSLAQNADSSMELICVDDASPLRNETIECFRRHNERLSARFGRVVVDYRDTNVGFAKGYNDAANRASGEVLIVANSDLYFPCGSVRGLADTLLRSEAYGIVGPVTNDCYSIQKADLCSGIRDYDADTFEHIETLARFIRGSDVGTLEAPCLSGFCFAIRSEIAGRFGLFDERFARAYFEDFDLCYRMKNEFKLIVDGSTYVHHGGVQGGSNSLWRQYSALWNTRRFFGNGLLFARRHGYVAWLKQMLHQNAAYHFKRYNLTQLYEKEWLEQSSGDSAQ